MRRFKNILFLLGITIMLTSCVNTNTNNKYRGEEDNTDYGVTIPSELYDNGQKEYRVNHYLQNNNGEYTDPLYRETLVGQVGEKTNAQAKEIEGFRAKSIEQKDITKDDSISVDIYYEVITYTINLESNSENAGIAGSGTYNRYNDTAYLIARPYIGYKFLGWYSNNDLLSNDLDYSFKVNNDLDIIAKFEMKEEFIPFEFESNLDECIITGLLDKSIKDLVIPEGVTEIHQYAFINNNVIEKVTLPESLKIIDSNAFYDCTNIFCTIIKSKVEFVSNCFSGCHKLLEVYDLGNNNIDLSSLSSNYGRLNTYAKAVHTSIDDESIYDIDQNGFLFTTIENVNYLVGYIGTENEIVLPTKNYNYKIYKYAFYDKDFSALTIPACVTEFGSSSFDCYGSFSSHGIKHLYEIYNLSSISLTLGSTDNGYVAKNAKIIHTSLEEEKCIFTIGDFIYRKENISSVDYARIVAYTGDENTNTIEIPTIGDLKIIIDKSLFDANNNSNFRKINEVILSENVVTIDDKAFKDCNNIKRINLENVEKINYLAFSGCKGLEEANLVKCTFLDQNAFTGCISLKKVNILECETVSSFVFNGCTALEEVNIPKVKTIDASAFYNCYSLLQITLPSTLTTINSNAFFNCFRLVEIINKSSLSLTIGSSNRGYVAYYAKNITSSETNSKLRINNNLVTYEDGTDIILMDVIECGEELVIPTNVTGMARLALFGMQHITSLSTPVLDNVLAYYFSPDQYISNYNTNLPNKINKIYLTGNMTSIPANCFKGRKAIKEINIPATVESIGSDAFSGMLLDNLYYDGSITDWINVSFADESSNPMLYSNNSYLKNDNGTIIYGNKKYSSITIVSLDGLTSIGAYQFAGLPFETLTIPSTVVSIGDGAFKDCKNLTTVNIQANINSIPESLFSGCAKLKNINIPSTVTEIGDYAFYKTGLNEIELLNNINSVGCFAFSECISLIKVTLPNVEIKSGLFQNCINLQKVNLDSNIETIGANAFNGCKSLVNLVIPNNLTTIGIQAFAYSNIKTFKAPATLNSLGGKAFYGCQNLKEVDLGDTSLTQFSNYEGASIISGCKKLETMILPDTANSFSTEFVRDYPALVYEDGLYFGTKSNPYYYLWGLASTTVTDFNIIHADCRYIWDDTFSNYSNLKSVTIPNTVTYYGAIFSDFNTSLTSITLPRIDRYLGDLFGGSGWDASTVNYYVPTSLKTITITSGSNISADTFNYCSYIESVYLSNDITTIGSGAFERCYSLRTINIPTSLTEIDSEVFYYCTKLHSITIPSNITDIKNYAFYGCESLIEVINLSDRTITAGSTDYGYVAYYALSVHDGSSQVVTTDNDGYMFAYMNNKGYLIDYIGNSASLTLPSSFVINNNTITEYEIYSSVFEYNYIVEDVIISDAVTKIGDNAFKDCYSLESVVISNSVKEIGINAFSDCILLASVQMGNGIEEILGEYSFAYCEELTQITYSGKMADFELIKPSNNNWYEYSLLEIIVCTDGNIVLE